MRSITALDAPVAGDFEEEFFLGSVAFVVSFSVASVVSSANSTTAFTTTEPLFQGKAQTTVNGETRQGVTYSVNAQTKKSVTFTYNGEGTFKSWTDNLSALGLAEGTDYTKVLNADGSQTIRFISQKAITSWNNGSVVVNAVVEFADDTTEATEKDTTKAVFFCIFIIVHFNHRVISF